MPPLNSHGGAASPPKPPSDADDAQRVEWIPSRPSGHSHPIYVEWIPSRPFSLPSREHVADNNDRDDAARGSKLPMTPIREEQPPLDPAVRRIILKSVDHKSDATFSYEEVDEFGDQVGRNAAAAEDPQVEEKFGKYFGYLHQPWERMRLQKPFCRVCRTRFWMSELIFCRALPDLGIFKKTRRGVIF